MPATTLRDVIYNTLSDDATLLTLLPGGFLDSEQLPRDGGGMDAAPKQADGITINPFAIIRWGEAPQYGPDVIAAEIQTVEVYVYADVGYAAIEAAISRIKALLNRTFPLGASDRTFSHFRYITASRELVAEELGGAPCMFVRFANTQIR